MFWAIAENYEDKGTGLFLISPDQEIEEQRIKQKNKRTL